jgi:hypothetical protein
MPTFVDGFIEAMCNGFLVTDETSLQKAVIGINERAQRLNVLKEAQLKAVRVLREAIKAERKNDN